MASPTPVDPGHRLRTSVILFDGGYRESFHTLDFLADQNLPADRWEIVWVDWRDQVDPRVLRHERIRKICLGRTPPYHIGCMVNAAVRETSGDLLVIMDADVALQPGFLAEVTATHESFPDLVMHVKRLDQPSYHHDLPVDLETLQATCEPVNQTNYGGCCSVERKWFEAVNGYTESPEFSSQSGVAMEFHHRLMNHGLNHMWHPSLRLYHPWHDHGDQRDEEHIARQHAAIGHVVTKRVLRAEQGYDVVAVV